MGIGHSSGGLGNAPRRNMSAEDYAIKARLAVMDFLMAKNQAKGMTKEDASRAAFDVAVKLNRKQAEAMLADLRREDMKMLGPL